MNDLVEKHPLPWKNVYKSWGCGDYEDYIEDANGGKFHFNDYEDEIVNFINENYNELKEKNNEE